MEAFPVIWYQRISRFMSYQGNADSIAEFDFASIFMQRFVIILLK